MSIALRISLKLLIGIAIFVGLPLVGWSVKDVRGFFGHPARLSYTITAVLLQAVVVTKFPQVGSRRGGREKIGARERLALVPLQVIPLAIVIAAPYCDRRAIAVLDEPEVVRYFGLILFSLGFAGMHWAEASLGKQFSVYVTVQDDHELVTTGPYRYLRHPRYLGIIVFTMGFALIYRSWLGLILVAALAWALVGRIRGEEALMRRELGTGWDAYSKNTWRLIPFVY